MLLAVDPAFGQQDRAIGQHHFQRLRGPATVRGFIGGESHGTYVIRARKGRIMTVQISWQHQHDENGDNHAEFYVTDSDFNGDGIKFGSESNKGRRWTGKIPRNADYYIHVMAHPTAHYTLKVTLK
jgi:hypothetical protein